MSGNVERPAGQVSKGLLKNGDWLRAAVNIPEEKPCCEVPVPLFRQAANLQVYVKSVATDELSPPFARGRRARARTRGSVPVPFFNRLTDIDRLES
jgi:hypothetical protein